MCVSVFFSISLSDVVCKNWAFSMNVCGVYVSVCKYVVYVDEKCFARVVISTPYCDLRRCDDDKPTQNSAPHKKGCA